MVLQFHLLGQTKLVSPGGDVSATSASRSIELLAYLVLHAGELVPRQYLAGIFWPDSTGSQSLTNLRRELHQLKGLLGSTSCLAAHDGALGWRDGPECQADVREFAVERDAAANALELGDTGNFLSHAQQGISLYRGELMPGDYADWVLEARDNLRTDFVRLCDGAAAAWLASGDLDRAAAVARRRIHAEPLEEIGYRELIRVQAAQGDRAAAMHTFHECSGILEQQLGIGPDAATVKLAHDLLGHRRSGARREAPPAGCHSARTATLPGTRDVPADQPARTSDHLRPRRRGLWLSGHLADRQHSSAAGRAGNTRLALLENVGKRRPQVRPEWWWSSANRAWVRAGCGRACRHRPQFR